MALLILIPERDTAALAKALKQQAPALDLRTWPDVGDPADIDYVIVWNHPAGALAQFPNLKVIASFGAGVDHIFRDPDLPANVPITRLVDDSLTRQMAEYVAGVILNHRLRLTEYREYQAAGHWRPQEPRPGQNVCLLGLGHIGGEVARLLIRLEYTVCGWSRSPKDLPAVACHHGPDGLDRALADADYVVCLLPLTGATENILNQDLFRRMKKGAYLINAGRGGHLNEDELLDALYQEQVGGACLDVFKTEPLPADHPFWRHPRIAITPHIASLTDIDKAAAQFLENHRNMQNGRALVNTVDPGKGY